MHNSADGTVGERMKMKRERAEILALNALGFIAADDEYLSRFLALTGMDADGLRGSAGETGTLVAVIDFLMYDDQLVLSFAKSVGIMPNDVAQVRLSLAGPEVDPV